MLAIVIPYFKLRFFEETLQSLANQTDKRFSVYIGDDASPEDPTDLLNRYNGYFDLVYYRFSANLGATSLTQHWERCIVLSVNEEWMMILGDDDVLGENVVAEFYEHLPQVEKKGINVVRFATQVLYVEDNTVSDVFEHPQFENATDAFWRKFIEKTRSSLSEYIFSRKSFDEFKFKNFPLAWHADDLAWLEFSNCGSIYAVNQSTVIIRLSHLNISGRTDNQFLKEKARFLFFKTIVLNSKFKFSKKHKIQFLFEFGILIKEQNAATLKNVFQVFFQFLQIGEFYNGMRFLRRMIRAKQNK
nr:glycosyltransferase [uncultured Flavobacterium sp.]